MKRLIPIFILATVVGLAAVKMFGDDKWRVEAAGDVIVKYLGVPLSGPVFDVAEMLPGDCVERKMTAKNEGVKTKLAVRADKKVDEENMARWLNVSIRSDSNNYFENTLGNFYDQAVPLGELQAGANTEYTMKVCFDENAGNELMGKKNVFDLVFMQEDSNITVPTECSALAGSITKVIEGTEGNDRIRGTLGNDLIISKGGNDVVTGGLGHDCIVGGNGNDKLEGGLGNDIVVGGDGNDDIDGGLGIDKLLGGGGNDKIDGSLGNDNLQGGDGNDQIEGGLGNDRILGENGNDMLWGGIGTDFLDGGEGTDTARGDMGHDKCVAENKHSCEE